MVTRGDFYCVMTPSVGRGYFETKVAYLPSPCLLTPRPKCERLAQPKFRAVEGLLASAPSISSLISAAEQGDRAAGENLFGMLYSELHRLAKRELARRGVPVSLSATTLLHQTY